MFISGGNVLAGVATVVGMAYSEIIVTTKDHLFVYSNFIRVCEAVIKVWIVDVRRCDAIT